MDPLSDLRPEQRAVLQLVLVQGRSYVEIAVLLRTSSEAVSQRARDALRGLALDCGLSPPDDDGPLIDYLLDQQGVGQRRVSRQRLGTSPQAMTWARALGIRLAPLTTGPLERLPQAEEDAATQDLTDADLVDPGPQAPFEDAAPTDEVTLIAVPAVVEPADEAGEPAGDDERRVSLVAVAIGLGVIGVICAVVIALLVGHDSSSGKAGAQAGTATAAATTLPPASTGQPTTSTRTPAAGGAQVVSRTQLNAPSGGGQSATATIYRQGTARVLSLEAKGVAANRRDAYAVWLTGAAGQRDRLLGFVTPKVSSSGTFTSGATLPDVADKFKRLVISRETISAPAKPATIVLQGPLRLTSATG